MAWPHVWRHLVGRSGWIFRTTCALSLLCCASSGCPSRDNPLDPERCDPRCKAGETCWEGGCRTADGGPLDSTADGTTADGCPGASACGDACCSAEEVCVDGSCARSCIRSSECSSPANCCVLQPNGQGACLPTPASGNQCLCSVYSDCVAFSEMSCAPMVRDGVISSKHYVCKPNDATEWHGCHSGCCPQGYDCMADGQGNQFCTLPCQTDPQCGNPGVACCNKVATCHNCVLDCEEGGCMTCP